MTEALLVYENVSAYYGAIQALHNVSLEIHKNEIVTLIGANGAGKSTLLMSLFGYPPISQGDIFYQGVSLKQYRSHQIAKLGISISPEGRRVFPKMTTEENLLMGALSQPKNQQHKNLHKVYALFPLLQERKTQRAGTLSGGEQQMLAIGRALMSEPVLFLLDEPSLGLAPRMIAEIYSALKQIAAQGTTLFLVEQNAFLALETADRAYVLTNGEIQMQGEAKTLLNDPNIKAAYFGAS